MASEDEEVAALDRVLTRTVLTKDDDLQQLLAKLLPALVQKLATAQPKTRAKVLELLSHINKRVRALPGCSLPLLPLLQLAVGASPMVASFGLVYVEMGQPRASPEEQLQAVPLLLSGISRRAQQHRAVALRVATAALSLLQQAPGGNYSQVIAVTDKSSRSSSSSSKPVAAVSLLPPAPEDRAVLLRHALKLMLYQRPSSGSRAAPTPLGLANAAAAAAATGAPAAAQAAAAAAPPPPGLSAADVLLLEEKGVPSQEQLVALKLGLLALLGGAAAGMPGNTAAAAATAANAAGSGGAAAGGKAGVSEGGAGAAMDVDSNAGGATAATATAAAAAAAAAPVYLSSEELLLVLLAASCDPYEAVARRGADLLQKLVNPDAAKPAVDLESVALVGGLTALLLGDQDPGAPQPAAAPAGPALAVRIMQLLVRSVAAAQAFPAAPLVLSACMYGPASSPRLLRLGAEWAGWMFKHAPAHQLRAMAGPLLQRLLAALGLEGAEAGDAMQVDGAPAGAGGTAVAGLAGSAEARGHVFSALAQLSQRLPDLFQSDTALASRLFAALGAEPPGSRTALQEALGGLAAAMGQGIQGAAGTAGTGAAGTGAAAGSGGALPPSKVEELEGLLLSSISSEQAAVRLCAAQWAAKLFLRSHMPSRYVCLLAAGDAKPEVREAGLTGLGLSATQLPAEAAAAPSAYAAAVAGLGLPLPGAVVAYLVAQHRQLAQPGDLSRPLPLPDASCKALAAFLRAAATAAAHSSSSSSGPDAPWAAGYSLAGHALLLEGLACRAAGRDTVCAALEGLVELLGGTAPWLLTNGSSGAWQVQVAELRERAAARQAWLCHFLAHHHQPVRLAAARLTALAAAAAQLAAAEALLQQLLAALPPVGSAAAGSAGGGGSRLEEQEGSLLAAGLILARSASCGSPALPPELQQSATAALTQQLRHHSGSTAGAGGSSNGNAAGSAAGGRSLVLAGAAALALGFVSLAGQAALPGLLTDGSGVASGSGGDAAPAAAAAASGSDSVAAAAAAAAATGGAGSGASCGSTGRVAPSSVLGVLLGLAGNGKDSRAALRAVAAVGYIAAGSGDQQVHLAAAKGLLALSCSKGLSEELLLGLGEAAAAAAGDVSGFNPALLLWSNLDSIADCVDVAEAAAAGPGAAGGTAPPGQQANQQQAAAMDVDTAAADGPSSSSSRGGVQEYLLAELGKMAVAPKEEVRCASCLLLVSLLQLCKGSGLLAGRLPQLQATFTGLLGDSNELTQDLAARGVSLVYSRGGAPLQQQLLGQLLGLLQGGPGAPAAAAAGAAGVKLAGDSKLFEEGQLGATPGGGGLTTYRELCSLANDLGQPDLVYRFMDLARASSALSAKRGAAVGVARIARLAAAATPGGTGQPGGGSRLASLLGPARLASLLPKLYRLCHDPSPKVSDSMSAIWAALLDDPRAAVDAHYDDIMK
uniref:Proteasome component Ecm29 N-terminal domain-containing protein n=1 Tax=Tetradesmus obliquus TaxID=3088 RepID=A0A383W1Y8_TETOB|eukprot:jgi/Sobl393_1/16079/SZX71149.1